MPGRYERKAPGTVVADPILHTCKESFDRSLYHVRACSEKKVHA